MKNQNQKQIRLSETDAHRVVYLLRYERASCVKNLADAKRLQIRHDVWEREIAHTDALIATIEAQL